MKDPKGENGGKIHAQGTVSMRDGTGRNGHEKARAGDGAGSCGPVVDQLATANGSACVGNASGFATAVVFATGAPSAGMMP